MEEAVAAPVGRFEPAPEVVPVLDGVHRLVADDLLEDVRRRRPVDVAQHQEAAVEPRAEEMREVGVEPAQLRMLAQVLQELLAHPDQRRSPAGREVEASQQLLPPRLGGCMQGLDRVRLASLNGRHRRLHRGAIRAELLGEELEEGAPLFRRCVSKVATSARASATPRPRHGGQQQVAEGREVGAATGALARAVAAGCGRAPSGCRAGRRERRPALAVGRDGLAHGGLLWSEIEAHPGTTMKMSQRTIGATTVTIAP